MSNLINVTLLKDSTFEEEAGCPLKPTRLRTFLCEFPRIVLAGLNTHGMLSKSAASSRAIPFEKMVSQQLGGRPVRFGEKNSGMQDKGENHTSPVFIDNKEFSAKDAWEYIQNKNKGYSEAFYKAGYHKQVYNRITEPYQKIRVLITGTDFNNFYWLRCDRAADPTISELSTKMKEAEDMSIPRVLHKHQYHAPFVDLGLDGKYYYLGEELSIDLVPIVSSALCAATSFRNENYTVEKCIEIYTKLVMTDKKHSGALEHVAIPATNEARKIIPHLICSDTDEYIYFGRARNWIQHRKFIKDECMRW